MRGAVSIFRIGQKKNAEFEALYACTCFQLLRLIRALVGLKLGGPTVCLKSCDVTKIYELITMRKASAAPLQQVQQNHGKVRELSIKYSLYTLKQFL